MKINIENYKRIESVEFNSIPFHGDNPVYFNDREMPCCPTQFIEAFHIGALGEKIKDKDTSLYDCDGSIVIQSELSGGDQVKMLTDNEYRNPAVTELSVGRVKWLDLSADDKFRQLCRSFHTEESGRATQFCSLEFSEENIKRLREALPTVSQCKKNDEFPIRNAVSLTDAEYKRIRQKIIDDYIDYQRKDGLQSKSFAVSLEHLHAKYTTALKAIKEDFMFITGGYFGKDKANKIREQLLEDIRNFDAEFEKKGITLDSMLDGEIFSGNADEIKLFFRKWRKDNQLEALNTCVLDKLDEALALVQLTKPSVLYPAVFEENICKFVGELKLMLHDFTEDDGSCEPDFYSMIKIDLYLEQDNIEFVVDKHLLTEYQKTIINASVQALINDYIEIMHFEDTGAPCLIDLRGFEFHHHNNFHNIVPKIMGWSKDNPSKNRFRLIIHNGNILNTKQFWRKS